MPPPTRANSAIELAPIEKPVKIGRTVLTKAADSEPNILKYTNVRAVRPSRPRPTTHMPMTEPPAKATASASGKPLRAAFVVRMLAAVATRMPK